jgi:hypothetical protein
MAETSELTADLSAEYRLRFGPAAEYRRKVWRTLIDEYFARFVKPTDAVLDLGSGWGEFIDQVAARERIAIDMNPDAHTHLAPGVKLPTDAAAPWPLADAHSTASSPAIPRAPARQQPPRALKEAHRCPKPGGRMICPVRTSALHGRYWDFSTTTRRSPTPAEGGPGSAASGSGFIERFPPVHDVRSLRPPLWTLRAYL